MKKRFLSITLALMSALLIFSLTACGSEDSDYDAPAADSQSQPQYDADSAPDGGGDDSWDDGDSGGDASLLDEPMTPERAEAIFTAFAVNSYEDYMDLREEAWQAMSADERTAMYEEFSAIAPEMGLTVSKSESEWLESMDWNIDTYNLFLCALMSLGSNNSAELTYLQSVYSYEKGIYDGKYGPLPDELLAVADNLRVEYHSGSYLLCVGGDHNIQQMTYEWTTQEESFYASGSVTAVKTDDIFTDMKASYSINGENGIFKSAKFASTDFLPIFQGIGAIDESGAFLTEQIDICAVNVFDAEILYVLSREDIGIITIAVAVFDEAQEQYVWDGQTYMARDRCCFNRDNEFCYVDLDGNLQNLTKVYVGGV